MPLGRALAGLVWASLALVAQITGPVVPELSSFDTIVPEIMARHQVPGGALAISYRGRLVYREASA